MGTEGRSFENELVRLTVAAFATWRLAHLLAREDGPGQVVARLRRRLGNGSLGELADCFNCLSIWVAAPLAVTVTRRWRDRAVALLALSGAACLLERLGGEVADLTTLVGSDMEETI